MTTRRFLGYFQPALVGILLYTVSGLLSVSLADVTSSGLGTAVNQPAAGVFNIRGGTRPNNGPNLFHSFGNFSLNTPESANFLNSSGLPTTNILSRVTGGNPSSIFGTINTLDFPGANLFLMNPAGIVFGPAAQLNVSGSFHATTADYIKLGNDGVFFADPTKPTVLSVAPPSAFGFLPSNPNPAPIHVQAGVFDFDFGFTNVLQVPAGQTLSLVGGPINVGAAPGAFAGGFVLAPGGRVNLVSVASPGEARFDGTGFSVDAFARLGDISLKGSSVIDGKEVFIRGGRLVIEKANILPGFFSISGLGVPPNGGEVNIQVSDSVNIKGPPSDLSGFSGILTFAGIPFAGDTPDITIHAGSVSVTNGAIGSFRSSGGASDVTITADTVELRNGGSISNRNFFGGGGTLTVNARDVTLDSGEAGSDQFTGLSTQTNFHTDYGLPDATGSFAKAFLPSLQLAASGSITISATNKLTVAGNARITTDSGSFGRSGNITVHAGDIHLTGAGAESGAITAQSNIAGGSGNVTLTATGKIDIENGFRVSANTFGSADGGKVQLTAGKSITLTGADSRILSGTLEIPHQVELDSFAQIFNAVFETRGAPPILDYATLRAVLGIDPRPGDLVDVLAALNSIVVGGNPLVAVTDFTPGNAGTISISTPLLTMNADTNFNWVGSVRSSGGPDVRQCGRYHSKCLLLIR